MPTGLIQWASLEVNMALNKLRHASNTPLEVNGINLKQSLRSISSGNTSGGEVYASTVILNSPFILNPQEINSGYINSPNLNLYNAATKTWTIPRNYNALSAGYLSLEPGVTVTVSAGSRWTIT